MGLRTPRFEINPSYGGTENLTVQPGRYAHGVALYYCEFSERDCSMHPPPHLYNLLRLCTFDAPTSRHRIPSIETTLVYKGAHIANWMPLRLLFQDLANDRIC